jgi:hypothetical protein
MATRPRPGSRARPPSPSPLPSASHGALTRLDRAIATTSARSLRPEGDGRKPGRDAEALRGALAETGIDTDKMNDDGPVAGGVGGPFVPFKVDPSAGPFEATLNALQPRIAAVTACAA